ncbi:MAG: hypothetical protein K0Q85_208 [Caproiciproducens sp.]|nr:hypothetical protein [Caproiciproducens sp.]
MGKSKRNFWIIWLIVTTISFLLFFLGIKFILGSQITVQNTMAYIIVSLVFGAVSSCLYLLKLKIACVALIAGILVGFFEMYRMFFNDLNGWGDLVGLMSLFTWMVIGLCAGAVGQFGYFLYKKISLHKKEQ